MTAGPGLVGLAKRSGAPRSMSGCEALRDVAEACIGGCLAGGWWWGSGSGTVLNGPEFSRLGANAAYPDLT